MKQREQALLFLRKAAQDEALLDEVIAATVISDEIFGFHCQQAAEKLLKALLSDMGVRFRKTHELGALIALIEEAGRPLPDELRNLDALTPFGSVYRYEDFDSELHLDRQLVRASLGKLRGCVERRLRERNPE
jgi:HEPN domain-containing protein